MKHAQAGRRSLTRVWAIAGALLAPATLSIAQTRGAELTSQKKPDFPVTASVGLQQGNVLLIGRIDKSGTLQDLRVVASTLPEFVAPALAAARVWTFKPAMRDGKAIDVAANIGMRFRLTSKDRGQIAKPILGDLSVSPADAAGKATAPEGFPMRRGADKMLLVESSLDVSPLPKARQVAIKVDAVSPQGRRVKLFETALAVKPGSQFLKFSFAAPVGADWQDGVWRLRFTADGVDAGGGQFWLAGDPTKFDFASALRLLKL